MFFSIVLSAYNEERWLPEAIESTLAQTHRDFELLLIDDGSTDRTLPIMQQYAARDARVRVITHENWGITRSRNDGTDRARGDWIAVMDADDVMLPERLERQAAFLAGHPEVDVTACLAIYINERSKIIGRKAKPQFTHPRAAPAALERGDVILVLHSGMVVRRAAVQAVGGYREAFMLADDADLMCRLVEAGYLLVEQPEHLHQYRFRQKSVSARNYGEQQRQLRWTAYCSRQRRAQLPEPTYAQFLKMERSGSRLRALNVSRKDAANDHFHRALWAYANGARRQPAADVVFSAVLDPARAARRIGPHAVYAVRRRLRPSPPCRARRV